MFEEEYKLNQEIDERLEETDKIELESYLMLEPEREKGEKVCNLAAFLDYQNNNIDSEIKRLQELKKKNEKKIDNCKNYLYYLVKKTGLKQFNTRRVAIRKSKIVEIDKNIDLSKVDERFINMKVEQTISKEKVKEYLNEPCLINQKTGEIEPNRLDWARIIEKDNVIIK